MLGRLVGIALREKDGPGRRILFELDPEVPVGRPLASFLAVSI